MRLPGKGEGGGRGGPPGDLYVMINVRPHDLFQRSGDDLYCRVPVAFEVAALGGEIEVPTIDGMAKLKLAPGTETGKTFRLRNKGVPGVEGHGRGDLHVQIVAEVPVKLSGHQKKMLSELLEIGKDANYPERMKFHKTTERFMERKNAIKKSDS